MRLEFSRFVENDLDAIAGYIAQDNPRRALTFVQEVRVKLFDIGRNALLYRLRPDIGDGARLATVGHYAILFRVVGESVRIERITYGGRDLAAMLDPTA